MPTSTSNSDESAERGHDEQGHAGEDQPVLAAIDLGSNSFHMILARLVEGELRTLDRLREPVRLAAGLDEYRRLRRESRATALECLARFGERVRYLPGHHVRAVGTSTLRRARNGRSFLRKAEKALGHPIDVITGIEEARLIYAGVSRNIAPSQDAQLVVDIGGGSTEIILGSGHEVIAAQSLRMGCVNFSLEHFPEGTVDRERFKKATRAATRILQDLSPEIAGAKWAVCLGASGTVHSLDRILRAWPVTNTGLNLEGLRELRKAMITAGSAGDLDVPELRPDRRPVLAGGIAILFAIMKELGIEQMDTAPGALREGLLVDLMGRVVHEDVREASVQSFQRRFQVDVEKASQVEVTALRIFDQVQKAWKLDDGYHRKLLSWGSRLHSVGLAIAHSGQHKHAEYLIAHSDLAGFTRDEQHELAALVRSHRRKLSTGLFQELTHMKPRRMLRLSMLLRLARLLHRTRKTELPEHLGIKADRDLLALSFPEGWLVDHPLVADDLDEEARRFRAVGYSLVVE